MHIWEWSDSVDSCAIYQDRQFRKKENEERLVSFKCLWDSQVERAMKRLKILVWNACIVRGIDSGVQKTFNNPVHVFWKKLTLLQDLGMGPD